MNIFRHALVATTALVLVGPAVAVAQDAPPAPKIIMVSGPLFDPFFSSLKKGADDAAAHLGITYQYTTIQDANNAQADMARLLDQAVASGPDAIVAGNYFPDAMGPIMKRATESGIPVVVQDGGYATWQDVGAFAYVGYDPESLGVMAGEAQVEAGVNNGICLNHVPGNVSLESLCNSYIKAIEDAGGTGKLITMPLQDAQNPQANLQAFRGALEADRTINGIMTLGATQTTLAAQAASESGFADGEVKIGGTGLSNQVLEDVRDGKVLFGVDLQAYLDGYYGIILAYQKAVYDLAPVTPVMAGPRFIFKEDAQKIIDVNTQYVGIRGTN